jgi:hypothetical protein
MVEPDSFTPPCVPLRSLPSWSAALAPERRFRVAKPRATTASLGLSSSYVPFDTRPVKYLFQTLEAEFKQDLQAVCFSETFRPVKRKAISQQGQKQKNKSPENNHSRWKFVVHKKPELPDQPGKESDPTRHDISESKL